MCLGSLPSEVIGRQHHLIAMLVLILLKQLHQILVLQLGISQVGGKENRESSHILGIPKELGLTE